MLCVLSLPFGRSSEEPELSMFLQNAKDSWNHSMRRLKHDSKTALEQADERKKGQRLVHVEYEQNAAVLQGKLNVAVAALGTTRDFLAWWVSRRRASIR